MRGNGGVKRNVPKSTRLPLEGPSDNKPSNKFVLGVDQGEHDVRKALFGCVLCFVLNQAAKCLIVVGRAYASHDDLRGVSGIFRKYDAVVRNDRILLGVCRRSSDCRNERQKKYFFHTGRVNERFSHFTTFSLKVK